MCIEYRSRHTCQHLGRILGFKGCQYYELNEELLETGVQETDYILKNNLSLCRRHSKVEFYDRDDMCVTCAAEAEDSRKKKGKGKDKTSKGKQEDPQQALVNDEARDTIMSLFRTPLYDPKKKVKFSFGSSSSDSSRTSSLVDASSFPRASAEGGGGGPDALYPTPPARFDYPIGDLTMQDLDRFHAHFQIRAPISENWIFHAGLSSAGTTRAQSFAESLTTTTAVVAHPSFPTTATHFTAMYPSNLIPLHLTKYLRPETHWKAHALTRHHNALSAHGRVHLLLPRECKNPRHPYPDGPDGGAVDSYWELFEMWALTSLGRVREIVRHDAEDFAVVGVLWRAGMAAWGREPDFWLAPRPVRSAGVVVVDAELYSAEAWT